MDPFGMPPADRPFLVSSIPASINESMGRLRASLWEGRRQQMKVILKLVGRLPGRNFLGVALPFPSRDGADPGWDAAETEAGSKHWLPRTILIGKRMGGCWGLVPRLLSRLRQ